MTLCKRKYNITMRNTIPLHLGKAPINKRSHAARGPLRAAGEADRGSGRRARFLRNKT